MSQTAIQSSAAAQAIALAQYGQHNQAASVQESGFSTVLESAMADGGTAGSQADISSMLTTLLPMLMTSSMFSDSGSSMSMMLPMLMMVLLMGQSQSSGTSKTHLNSLLAAQRESQAEILDQINTPAATVSPEDCGPSG